MLDEKQFTSLSKHDIYQIYVKTYKKLEENEKFIETTVTKFTQAMEIGMLSSIKTQSVSNIDAAIQTDDYELVRTFPKKPLQKANNNLVLGSSTIAKLENDKSIPADCTIHAYRGSTTNEKLKILNSYEDKK